MYRRLTAEERTQAKAARGACEAHGGAVFIDKGGSMGLKECPVCHARCFEDMDVCYGCLHSFAREASNIPAGARPPAVSVPVDCRSADRADVERQSADRDDAERRADEGKGGVGLEQACACASSGEACMRAPVLSGTDFGGAVRLPSSASGADAPSVVCEEAPEARAAAESRLVHLLDIVIGIRMAQDAGDRAAAAATLPVWVERAERG